MINPDGKILLEVRGLTATVAGVEILKGIRVRYEDHHKLKISDDALAAAAERAARYVIDRFLPDKAIDLIDEAPRDRSELPRAQRE